MICSIKSITILHKHIYIEKKKNTTIFSLITIVFLDNYKPVPVIVISLY